MIDELQKDKKPAVWGESSREGTERRADSADEVREEGAGPKDDRARPRRVV